MLKLPLTMSGQATLVPPMEEILMQLNGEQKKLLEWVEAKQPIIGLFHVMTNIAPMISSGLIETRPVPRSKGQLVITDAGRVALTLH